MPSGYQGLAQPIIFGCADALSFLDVAGNGDGDPVGLDLPFKGLDRGGQADVLTRQPPGGPHFPHQQPGKRQGHPQRRNERPADYGSQSRPSTLNPGHALAS